MIIIMKTQIPITISSHDDMRKFQHLLICRKALLHVWKTFAERKQNCVSVRGSNASMTTFSTWLVTNKVTIGDKLNLGMDGTNLFTDECIIVKDSKNRAKISFIRILWLLLPW